MAVAVLERVALARQVHPADQPSREVGQVIDACVQDGYGVPPPRIASGRQPRTPGLPEEHIRRRMGSRRLRRVLNAHRYIGGHGDARKRREHRLDNRGDNGLDPVDEVKLRQEGTTHS